MTEVDPGGRSAGGRGGAGEPRWSVGCHDAFGRDRAVTVLVDGGAVVLVPPAGASAVLSAGQTRRLGDALAAAADRAGGPA